MSSPRCSSQGLTLWSWMVSPGTVCGLGLVCDRTTTVAVGCVYLRQVTRPHVCTYMTSQCIFPTCMFTPHPHTYMSAQGTCFPLACICIVVTCMCMYYICMFICTVYVHVRMYWHMYIYAYTKIVYFTYCMYHVLCHIHDCTLCIWMPDVVCTDRSLLSW